jgi:hypothetical protein
MKGKTGTILQCTRRWVNALGAGRATELLAEFTGVVPVSIGRWLKGNLPVGITSIKLVVFLHMVGYETTDTEEVSGDIALARRIIAFAVTTPEVLAHQLGVSSDASCRYLRGKVGMLPARAAVLRAYVEQHQGALPEVEQSWRARVMGSPSALVPAAPEKPVVPAKNETGAVPAAIRSAKIADSLVSMFNTIANIATAGIDPEHLTDEVKNHIAFTTAQLFKRLGIDAATLARVKRQQEQHSTGVSEFSEILFPGAKK